MPSPRDAVAAGVATFVVAAAVLAGFLNLGGPSGQRQLQLDRTRVENLRTLSNEIRVRYGSSRKLPATLDEAAGHRAPRDPLTHQAYEYSATGGTGYQLCATFARDNRDEMTNFPGPFWNHPAGHHCYALDAEQVN